MAIQIFAGKGSDSQKAERFFKERRVSVQKIDTLKFGISKGELSSVVNAVGWETMIDTTAKAFLESPVRYSGNKEAILAYAQEHPQILRLPIVRSGKQATVGYAPEIWKTWLE